MKQLKAYPVWDVSVRWFHWINFVCVLALTALGLAILNDKALGVSNDGKILLKTVHVWIGYAFALNLLWRLVRAFIGGKHSCWRAILPGGRRYATNLRNYISGLRRGQSRSYLGHNPLGRMAITAMLLLLLTQAVTGLVLAGTDLFLPPIGPWVARQVVAPGVDPTTLVPYAAQMYDKDAYAAMRTWRAPFVTVHTYSFFLLLVLVVMHVIAVVITELRDGGALISAMFSGKKILDEPPVDGAPVDSD